MACGEDRFLAQRIPRVRFQRVQDPGDSHAMLFGEPRPRRAPLEGAMAAHLVPIGDVGRQRAPQRLKFPDRLLAIERQHIVPEGACKLAVGLGVAWRCMDERDPQRATECRQQFPSIGNLGSPGE